MSMKLSGVCSFVILISILFLSTPSFSEIYYWLDKNGRKHFTSELSGGRVYYTMDGKKISTGSSRRQAPPADEPGDSGQKVSRVGEPGDTGLLKGVSYTGTRDSLKAIQRAALPEAIAGNFIAITICRETMYALGNYPGLQLLTSETATPQDRAILDEWTRMVEWRAGSGAQTVLGNNTGRPLNF